MLDRSIILAVLAFQNGLIPKTILLDSIREFSKDPSQPIAPKLTVAGGGSTDAIAQLQGIVDTQIARFESSTGQTFLSMLPMADSLKNEILDLIQESHSRKDDDGPKEDVNWFSDSIEATQQHVVKKEQDLTSRQQELHRFRVIRRHAEGGLGVVYIAEDQQLRRQVALKQIRMDKVDQPIYRIKFTQEAEITGQLEHPGIVPVYAFGTDDNNRPYYAMRFIEGESMKEQIRVLHESLKSNTIEFEGTQRRQLLRRFQDVCDAIGYAHDRGILHRDIKPGNIMLGKHGETLVVDWGLAKPLNKENMIVSDHQHDDKSLIQSSNNSGSETTYGTFVGTLAYSSPEQIRGELDLMSPASDVYSLGCVLFELLCGSPPIEKPDSKADIKADILLQIKALSIAGPLKRLNSVPPPLDAICRRATAFEPQDRYASVAELQSEVQNWLDDLEVKAYPDGVVSKFWRWTRRNRAFASSAAATLVVATIASMVFLVFAQRTAITERGLRLEAVKATYKAEQQARKVQMQAAKLARGRGEFRSAAEVMSVLSDSKPFTNFDRIQWARDVLFSEDDISSAKILNAIDTQLLTQSEKAEYDLTLGTCLLHTAEDSQGLKLLLQSAQSGFLSEADQAFAKGMTSDLAIEAVKELDRCLELEPFHPTARVVRGLTNFVIGHFAAAREDIWIGKIIHPSDSRYLFLDAVTDAITGNKKNMQSHTEALAKSDQPPFASRAVKMVSHVNDLVESMSFPPTFSDRFRVVQIVTETFILAMNRPTPTGRSGFPVSAWMGRIATAIPTNPADIFAWLNSEGSRARTLTILGEQMPNSQLVQYFQALSSNDPDWLTYYKQWKRTQELDVMSPRLNASAAWWAMVSLSAVNSSAEVRFRRQALFLEQMSHALQHQSKTGRFDTRPIPLWSAWHNCIGYGFIGPSLSIAEQGVAEANSDINLLKWQRRLELSRSFDSQYTAMVQAIAPELEVKDD